MQTDALKEAGCVKIYQDKVSGTKAERPGLRDALVFFRKGDTLALWLLDWLGGSLKHLIETVSMLEEQGKGHRPVQPGVLRENECICLQR